MPFFGLKFVTIQSCGNRALMNHLLGRSSALRFCAPRLYAPAKSNLAYPYAGAKSNLAYPYAGAKSNIAYPYAGALSNPCFPGSPGNNPSVPC